MIEESNCCREVMKKYFNKELVMTKENNEDFKNSTKCWICDSTYVDGEVKVRGHCHITGKYKGSVHRYCNINAKLNHKVPDVFHNLRDYHSYLIMQELGKFTLKRNLIPKGLKKYMSFSINNTFS